MSAKRRLVVVGNGMAGARVVEDMLARGGGNQYDIAVFGEEPTGNYNRVLLSSVLARTHDPRDILLNPLPWYAANGITLHAGIKATSLDLSRKEVTGADGRVAPYDVLVIATGSRPLIPAIEGLHSDRGRLKRGVFVFRTLEDCDRMQAFVSRVRRAAVLGGGLLGLEAARGLLNAGPEVHVVHLMAHLMERQLDAQGGRILERQLEQMGLHVYLRKSTKAVLGEEEVAGLLFEDGTTLECEMVVVAAGVRANVELAKDAGLAVNRGIIVGDDLACDGAADVYAVGECAEHCGQVYGLVAPVWEQAQILADRLTGRNPRAVLPMKLASCGWSASRNV
jgi:nitrite reductase (NADH) large subunit